jgi:hypothetical protein
MTELINQDELDVMCPFMVEELDLFIQESETFKDLEEATIYALCQLVHNRLDKLDMSLQDKGLVVSTLIQGLIKFNKEPLAVHNEAIKAMREQRASTIQ